MLEKQADLPKHPSAPQVPFLYLASLFLLLALIVLSLFTASKSRLKQTQTEAGKTAQPVIAQDRAPHRSARLRDHVSPVAKAPAAGWTQLLSSSELATPAAQKIGEFLQTGKVQPLREIKRADLEALVQSVTERVPPEEIASWLEKSLNIPPQYFLQNGGVKSSIMGLYTAALGTSDSPNLSQTRLTFTDQCDTDGRITGSSDSIPSGTRRVYAVFENDGNLKDLPHVLAIWRDPSDDSISFTQCESLRLNSRYNYVWLQTGSGWPSGSYQLDLCNPANHSEILVTQAFNVE